jgi:hypothetical protein
MNAQPAPRNVLFSIQLCSRSAAQFLAVAFLFTTFVVLPAIADSSSDDVLWAGILDQGQDFTVYGTVRSVTDAAGTVTSVTNRFTLLGNALNYYEDGRWMESEDLIESFPDGAVARRGPNKALFSPELNDEVVFDIETSDGGRIRGGVRAFQITDLLTGRSLVLGTVRESVRGEMLAPDRILWRDAFDGIGADVLLVWRHNLFSHEVILKERPELPEDWDPAWVRIEVVTEFLVDREPELRTQRVLVEEGFELDDHAVIHSGSMAMIMGKAFSVEGHEASSLGGLNAEAQGRPVLKQWHGTEDGRRFVVESVSWADAWPGLMDLPVAGRTKELSVPRREVTLGRMWPERAPQRSGDGPMEVAVADYRPEGYMIDFVIIPDQGTPTTLISGETYYIRSSYYSGSSVTLQPGCVLKFKNNAYLLLYGPVSFPDTAQTPVFTSRNDDGFGEVIRGVPNEADSNGDPTLHRASQAIWIYYVNFGTTIRNVQVRWAQRAIQHDGNPGASAAHHIRDSLFQECAIGLYCNAPSASIYLSNMTKCNVNSPVWVVAGWVSGTVPNAPFCLQKSFRGLNTTLADFDPELGAVTAPPDTMGAVGPSHFVELIHEVIAVYDKLTGQRIERAGIGDFFGGPDMVDPRIVYDHHCQRWIACIADRSTQNVRLAVSHTSNPTGLLTNWTRYLLTVAEPGHYVDYPTLGVDQNGVYIAIHFYNTPGQPASARQKVVAIRKQGNCLASIASGDIHVLPTLNSPYKKLVLQPAVNFDSIGSDAIAWFVAKGDPQSGHGPIHYGRLKWINNQPQFLENPWANSLMVSTPYYDMDKASGTFGVPQKSAGGSNLNITELSGSRLMMAVVQGGSLWTCHHVGLNSSGGYAGEAESALRTGIQWLRIQTSPPVSISASGRVYDGSVSDPYWYYMPSLMVTGTGEMVMGFSGSRGSEFIGAFFTGRRADGTMPARPVLLQAGRSYYDSNRWGDYSYTSLDPADGSLWTIQQYSEAPTSPAAWSSQYGTWVGRIVKNP